MVKVVVLEEKEFKSRPDLVGKWLDDSHYHTLVEEDMDIYLPPDCADVTSGESCDNDMKCSSCTKGFSEKKIIFKFRKNFFTQEEADAAYAGLRDAAVETQNRGIAGGPRTGTCGGRDWVTDEQFDEFTKNKKLKFEVSFLSGAKTITHGHKFRQEIYKIGDQITIPKKWFYTLPDYNFNNGHHTIQQYAGQPPGSEKKIIWDESMFSVCVENSRNNSYQTYITKLNSNYEYQWTKNCLAIKAI